MSKQKRILALLIVALTVFALSASAFADVQFEGVSLEGIVITKSVQLKDYRGKKAGKLYEGDTVTIVSAFGNSYCIMIGDDGYEVPMSSFAVFYDEAFLATAKKSITVYSDIIAKSKYKVGILAKGTQFDVYGRIGNWYVLYVADTKQLAYVPVKNVDVYTGREGS